MSNQPEQQDTKKVCVFEYRTRVLPATEKYPPLSKYKLHNIRFCCEGMTNYVIEQAVGFGDAPPGDVCYHSFEINDKGEDRDIVRIRSSQREQSTVQVCIFSVEDSGDCCDGPEFDEYPIKFCPNCGAEIVCVEVEHIVLVPKTVERMVKETIYVEPGQVEQKTE